MKQKLRMQLPRATSWFKLLLLFALLVLLPVASWAEAEDMAESSSPSVQPDPELREWAILEKKAETDQLTSEEETRRTWLGGRLMKRALQAGHARFVLEGEVVDEDGLRLQGVSMRISKEKERGIDQWVEDKEDRLVNGTFSVKVRGYSDVRLYFSKEGYYPENIHFYCDGGDDPFCRIINRTVRLTAAISEWCWRRRAISPS